MSDVQTFIEVKQHPQAGPETPHTMCEKFEDFWKIQFSTIFWTFPMRGALPWLLITDYVLAKKYHFFQIYSWDFAFYDFRGWEG